MKKICILAVMLITNLCAGYFTGENQVKVKNVVQEQNTEIIIENLTDTEVVENEVIDEVLESEPTIEEIEKEIVEKKQVNNDKQENVSQENSGSETIKSVEIPTTIHSQNVQNIDNSQSNVAETKPEERSNVNQNKSENIPVETQKTNPEPKAPTQSDLSYWCVEGGSHHVLGDGANEHGYYSTWDEASIALNDYIKDWLGEQHKINQCTCGLYYFWAIQN